MQGKKNFDSKNYYNINLDRMVPEDHLLKKLNSLVSFVYTMFISTLAWNENY